MQPVLIVLLALCCQLHGPIQNPAMKNVKKKKQTQQTIFPHISIWTPRNRKQLEVTILCGTQQPQALVKELWLCFYSSLQYNYLCI